MDPITLVASVATATVVANLTVLKVLAHQVPPFSALVVQRSTGRIRVKLKGRLLAAPGAAVHTVPLTPFTASWRTPPAGDLVIADGARLGLDLKVWFQVRANAQHVMAAWSALGERLLQGNGPALQELLSPHIATAAGEVTRSWSATRIPTSARFRNDFLERADWSFRDMGLAASEVEVLRLEVTS